MKLVRLIILGTVAALGTTIAPRSATADQSAITWHEKTLHTPTSQIMVYTPVDQRSHPIVISVDSHAQGRMTMALFQSRTKNALSRMLPGFRKTSDNLVGEGDFQLSDIRGTFRPKAAPLMRVHELFFIERGTSFLVTAYYPDAKSGECEPLFQYALKRFQIRQVS